MAPLSDFMPRLRHRLNHILWQAYLTDFKPAAILTSALKAHQYVPLVLDHIAILDLPGPNTGIVPLKTLYSMLGYQEQGYDYLPDKQNNFLWMAEVDSKHQPASQVLPQIVLADFRREVLPAEICSIVDRYAKQAQPLPLQQISALQTALVQGDCEAEQLLLNCLSACLQHRPWSLPYLAEFETVHEFNELLAWVLVFGRRINHFAISVHHLGGFSGLTHFNQLVENELQLPLNQSGGMIKGGVDQGIAQSATQAPQVTVNLADGVIDLPDRFIEFVWRYPRVGLNRTPMHWGDYFTGFIGTQANRVIETLYVH